MPIRIRVILFVAAFLVAAAPARAAQQEIIIPFFEHSNTGAIVGVDGGGRLYYSIDWPNAAVVENSPLGVVYDGKNLGKGVTLGEPVFTSIDETFPTRGNHAQGRLFCNAAAIPATHKETGVQYTVEFRVCADGAAFRYIIPGAGKHLISGEATGFSFGQGAVFWHQNNVKNYEDLYEQTSVFEPGQDIGPPLTVELSNGWFAAVTESAVVNYSGMTLKYAGQQKSGDDFLKTVFTVEFPDDPAGWGVEGNVATPWRVVLIAPDLNALVNADLVWALAPDAPPELRNADWIRPGRCLWSWLNGGRAKVTPEEMRMYVDAAQQLGFEYVLVDDGWEDNPPGWREGKGWGKGGDDSFGIMAELVKYATNKGVGIWVWKHYITLTEAAYREKYFSRLAAMGVKGVKVDFMDSESVDMLRFYEDCLRDAAKHKLMINFHGANKPTGEARRWPNEMAREGIRGLEYRTMPQTHATALPFTRLLAGHADYTPMHFNPAWMFNASWPHQLASAIIFASPVTFYGAHPQDMLDSEARDLIQALPVLFDETIVLPDSRIGRLAAFARRSGDTWYIAVMSADPSRKIDIPLDFLGPGQFTVTAYMDAPAGAPAMTRAQKTVAASDTLPVRMRSFGGFAAMIKPVK
jgi:alpha-glucosidase